MDEFLFLIYLVIFFFQKKKTMAVITESIDDLVREAELLKSRLDEERTKFNDIERMLNIVFL